MCCFAGPVKFVSDTRIFARLSGSGTQHLAYQMRFDSEKPNAMILPLPAEHLATEHSIRFVDLSGYDRFFDDLDKGFPRPAPAARAFPDALSIEPQAKLKVHKVGSFEASFVPKMKDFSRLDPRFVIEPDVWAKLPIYEDYSFAVFQFKDLGGKPHPMAFEFKTRLPEVIFFPTVHIHDGQVHARERFDHELYCQTAGDDKWLTGNSMPRGKRNGFVRSKSTAENFVDTRKSKGLVNPESYVYRQILRGTMDNKDVLLAAKNPKDGGLGSRVGVPMKLIAGAWPLAWLIDRRHRLS